MGNARFDAGTYACYARSTAHLDETTKFKASSAAPAMDPKMIKVRESVKSDANPNPTPVIVGLDVTGSMSRVVNACHVGLGTLFQQIITRGTVSDPHVLAMAIGDMDWDRSPVQATQFEADPVVIGTQIEALHVEGGGGGNDHESYLGPLYFALMRTKCDAFNDGRKGYLFTVGDELPQTILTKDQIDKWFGDQPKRDYTAEQLVEAVSRNWHVFHVIVAEGNGVAQMGLHRTQREWAQVLGQRVIVLTDHTKMSEVIISAIEVIEGRNKDVVAHSWSGDTSLVVRDAIAGLTPAERPVAGPVAL